MNNRRALLVDSNAIVATDWFLKSAPWRVILYDAQQGHFHLVVPALVIQEVVGRYRASLIEEAEKARNANNSVRRLGVEVPDCQIDVDDLVSSYEVALRAKVTGAGGTIPDLPSVDLGKLTTKAIGRLRPFDHDGNGFRDAILWEHGLELVAQHGRVVLISGDRKAFHGGKDQPGLVGDLALELEQLGHARDAVKLYPDIGSYLKDTGTTNPGIFAAVAELLTAEEEQIGVNLQVALSQAEIEFRHGNGRVVIEQAFPPASVTLIDVSSADDHEVALVTLEGDADLDLYVEWWDGRQPDYGSGTETVTYTATASYDVRARVLDDFSVGKLQVDVGRDDLSSLSGLYEGDWLLDGDP